MKINLEALTFDERRKDYSYRCEAIYNGLSVGILVAKLFPTHSLFVFLETLKINSNFRRNRIATNMISKLKKWGREKNADAITGYILKEALFKDSPEHIAEFLLHQGFTVESDYFLLGL